MGIVLDITHGKFTAIERTVIESQNDKTSSDSSQLHLYNNMYDCRRQDDAIINSVGEASE